MTDGGGKNKLKIAIPLVFILAVFIGAVFYFRLYTFGLFVICTLVFCGVLGPLVYKIVSKDKEDYFDDEIENQPEEYIPEKETVENMPCAAAYMKQNYEIKYQNDEFEKTFGSTEKANFKNIIENFVYSKDIKTYSFENSFFDIQCGEKDESGQYYITVSDVTEREKLKADFDNNIVAAGFIYLDNYEEVFSDVESSVLPILTAAIDNKLANHFMKLGGVIKKFEKDRFLFVINKKSLDVEIESKFDILNEIRETKVSDHIALTLSIGVGTSRINMAEAMKNAKNAIDLAMGRGGDQAIIKSENGYQFYGAKSGEVMHNARVRARVKAEALKNLIKESDRVYVTGHKRPDFDSLGSAVGVYAIAKSLGRECSIIAGSVTAAIQSEYDLFNESNEYKGIFTDEFEALKNITEDTLLVIVDTHIKDLVECEMILPKFKKIVIFDHHRKSTKAIENPVLMYHEPYASSTSELITEVIRHLGTDVKLKGIEADALLAGIVVDTKNFGIKAGAVTFEAAAFLRRNGADSTRVRYLFKNDLELFKLKAEAIKRAELYRDGIIISVCDYAGDSSNMLAAQTADELLNVTGVRASIVLGSSKEKIFVSARSYGDVNVQVLLEKLGGGGHLTMAGAVMDESDMQDAMAKIKEAVDEYIEEEE